MERQDVGQDAGPTGTNRKYFHGTSNLSPFAFERSVTKAVVAGLVQPMRQQNLAVASVLDLRGEHVPLHGSSVSVIDHAASLLASSQILLQDALVEGSLRHGSDLLPGSILPPATSILAEN